jgi:hypothetical protein
VNYYGFFCGGNPNHFRPDPDSCTEKEIEAHKAACAAWNLGEQTPCEPQCGTFASEDGKTFGFWDGGAFGIGTFDDGEPDDEDEYTSEDFDREVLATRPAPASREEEP